METWDLFDHNRRPLGRIQARGIPGEPGEYHIVVSIWIVDSAGNILLTLRDAAKESYPGFWENSGGAMQAGETSRQAALRELAEETGIVAAEEELVLIGVEQTENSFVDHYLLRRDLPLSGVILQPGETADARWVTLEQLDAMVADLTMAKPIGEQFLAIRDKFLELLK